MKIFHLFIVLFLAAGILFVSWFWAKNQHPVSIQQSSIAPQTATKVVEAQAEAQLTVVPEASPASAAKQAQPTPPSQVAKALPAIPAEALEKLNEELREKPHYDEPDKAIEYYRLKRLPAGEKEIPVEKYLTAKSQMDAMPQYSTAQNRFLPSRNEMKASRTEATPEALGTWTPLGPGNIGGRTRALLIHPTSPNIMYAAGVAGGVWKTTLSGTLWQPLTDLMANIAVSCLAFDPSNPNTIYAGTGEGVFNGDAVRGAGIFRTTDGGANWTQLSATGTSDFYYVNDIIVSNANPQHLYAGTRTGVWRSLDGGATWSKVLSYTDGCLDLVIRTDQATDYVFASCGTFSGGEIFRNTDAGGAGAWASVQKETGMGRTSLALAPSNQNIIYALSASTLSGTFRDGLYAVFRSTNSGETGTWTAQVRNNNALKLNTILLTNPLGSFRSECGLGANSFSNQGWYDNVIAVDPLDANRVWAGGIDLFRSDDGGQNWGIASYWWPEPNVPQYAHADQHTIVFHPQYNGTTNKQMFIGNDGGIFRTDDARGLVAMGVTATCNPAASGVRWTSLNNNYGVTQFYHGAVFPDGKSYFGGAQDNGTLLGTDANGVNGWREIWGGDGGYVAIDPTNPQVLYASTQRGGFRKSTDGGTTFSSIRLGINDIAPLFIAPLTMDPSNPQILWTGSQRLWRSTNGGASWSQAGVIYASDSTNLVSAIAVAPTDSSRVLMGRSFGWLHTITDAQGAASFIGGTPRTGFVSWATFDPLNKNVMYVTYSTFNGKHIYRSTDAGENWISIDGNLPDIPVHCLVVDPQNTARLFIGTDLGVFASTDGGNSWNVENSGFANVPVESLALNTVNGVTSLYAFTHGRGVWRVNLGTTNCEFSLSVTMQHFNAAGGTGSFTVNSTTGCNWTTSSNVDWITITAGSNGNGAVAYSVAPNTSLASRAGTITVAGRSFTLLQMGKLDTSPPVVTITSPTTAASWQVSGTIVTLSGTVTDDDKVTSMRWSNDRGGGDSIAVNGNQWVAGVFALRGGVNQITVTAFDAIGKRGTATIKIVFFSNQIINAYAGTGQDGTGGDGGPALLAPMFPYDVAVDQEGNLYISEVTRCRIRKVTPAGIITTVAGTGVRASSGDGSLAVNAQLAFPWGIGVDKQGNVYIAEGDTGAIRKITVSTGIITTVVTAQQASLHTTRDVAVDKNGNLYIVDNGFHRIQKVTPSGVVSTFAGAGGGFAGDGGPATAALLNAPISIAVDDNDTVYFSDQRNGRLRKVTKDGIINSILSRNVEGVATDKDGNAYATSGSELVKVTPDGTIVPIVMSTFASVTGDGGPAISAKLSYPYGVTVDSAGSIYLVSDSRIRKISTISSSDTIAPSLTISSPTTAATHSTTNAVLDFSGSASDNLGVTHVSWRNDRGGSGIATGTTTWSIGNLGVQPGVNNISITAWDLYGNAGTKTLAVTCTPTNVVATVAGTRGAGLTFTSGDLANSLATASQLYAPETVALDGAGNLYIADRGNHRIRKITRAGLFSTVAGTGQLGSSGDGGPAINAALNQPNGIAVDGAGNLYIADTNNHRIRWVNATGTITTIAGTGVSGFSGDGGAATQAQLNTPVGISLDNNGHLLIADANNHRIRKLNLSTGIITTIAGNGYGFGGDGGQATQAQLNFPTSVAMDQNGNLYISDTSNHQVRKVTAAGIISRYAGTGFSGFSGDGGQANLAQFNAPGGLTVDSAGNLYVTDQGNSRVRKIAANGIISTFAGTGTGVINGIVPNDEGSAAINAALNAPAGVALDSAGNLFIADTNNHRVVLIATYQAAATVNGASYAVQQPVATEAIVSVFGANLATREQGAVQLPLPTELAGTSVKVRDSLGIERLAPLFYVGKLQVNYQIPAGTAPSFATVTITNGNGEIFTSAVNVTGVTPGIFAANQNGSGAAAASVLYVTGVNRHAESTAVCDANGQNCVARQIDVNSANEVYLELYGTGLRNNSGLANVAVTVGGVAVPVLYAGKQPEFVGLDQINVQLPRSLAARGEVDLIVTIDGKTANPVKIHLK